MIALFEQGSYSDYRVLFVDVPSRSFAEEISSLYDDDKYEPYRLLLCADSVQWYDGKCMTVEGFFLEYIYQLRQIGPRHPLLADWARQNASLLKYAIMKDSSHPNWKTERLEILARFLDQGPGS